ncbi:RICIN domain-containing protein [Niastella caeni]|uniref:RICIN domain-containing protein n=1 Tax=Niastella caeni TaxID=2569763 RepID=UPI001FB63F5B|nr:RICIN domain-containing protein [Niastella caeni]
MNVNSNMCLDVTAGSTSNGALIQQWGYAGSYNQQWTIEGTGDGYFKIINRNSGKCLDDSRLYQQWRADPTIYFC